MTLISVWCLRLIGNKTHGDLAEIAMTEFINQFMYDYRSVHVGKDLYRVKEHEEGKGHEAALQKLREDIEEQKKQSVQA